MGFEAPPPGPQGTDADADSEEPRSFSYCRDDGSGQVITTYVYRLEHWPPQFDFRHDPEQGVFVLTHEDGTVEQFRDKPARHLLVEPDPETGEFRPVVKRGRPAYLYFCREEREG